MSVRTCTASLSGLSPLTRGNPTSTRWGVSPSSPITRAISAADEERAARPEGGAAPDGPPAAPPTARIHAKSIRGSVSWFNGPSPTIQSPSGDRVKLGSIPAHAGEPRSGERTRLRSRVYPRSRGGTRCAFGAKASSLGLSPLTRGNLIGLQPRERGLGSIPARAGEPMLYNTTSQQVRVYPRSGGGTARSRSSSDGVKGLSPRSRGTGVGGWLAGG